MNNRSGGNADGNSGVACDRDIHPPAGAFPGHVHLPAAAF